MEYRGKVKDGSVMHGEGTLTLKGLQGIGTSFTGEWVNGECAKHAAEILTFKNNWQADKEAKEEANKKFDEEKKDRMSGERIYYIGTQMD